jgi:ectoine hydroxylase-related dioxygenase (phytanoyl-CoA dioxygenase family)
MTPSDQVGAWLAVTEATLENGPLWVLPGSHREPLHDVESDRRPGAQLGYVEITDHDIDGAIPVLLDPGDLLLFHAHLMHRSTDNFTEAPRAAMVYHFGSSGTHDPAVDPDPASLAGYLRDLGMEVEEPLAPSVEAAVRANVRNRWVPVRRGGRPVDQPLTGAEGSGS